MSALSFAEECMVDKTTEIEWIAESLDDLAIVIRELHGLHDIAAQLDRVRAELEQRAVSSSSRASEPAQF
jgi:hypothetical protein